MILSELVQTPQGFTGPWGVGYITLISENELGEFHDQKFYWHTHALYYHLYEHNSTTYIKLAVGNARRCPVSNLWYVQLELGSIRICCETTYQDTILLRIGYRMDFLKSHAHRDDGMPDPRILFVEPHYRLYHPDRNPYHDPEP